MALPNLPVQGQNPWYDQRSTWDAEVGSRLPAGDLRAVGQGELVLNVRDFGAEGNGVTNDTAAIQAAVDKAFSQGGGTVLVSRPGIYMISADSGGSVYNDTGGIRMRSNVTLLIAPGVTLRAVPVTTTVSKIIRIVDCENVTIAGGGTIDGNRANAVVTTGEWGYGVSVNGGKNITIENVHTVNCWGDGINLQKRSFSDHTPPSDVVIQNVVSDNNRRQGISVESGRHVLIEQSVFSGTSGALPTAGIDVEPADANGTIDFVIIRGNRIFGNDRMGIAVGEFAKINDVIIEDNQLDGNGSLGSVPQLRVIVGGAGVTVRGNSFLNTSGNVAASIAGPAYAGIVDSNRLDKDLIVTGTAIIASGFPRGSIVSRNTIIGGSLRVSYLLGFVVEGNFVRPRAGDPALNFGGSSEPSVIHGMVKNNSFEGGSNGILWNTVNAASFVSVEGNTFLHQTGQAMRLKGGDNLVIQGNWFEGCCLTSGDSVIIDLTDTNGAVRRRIERNTFKKDPRSGTVPTNVPLYAYKSEAILLQTQMSSNTLIGSSFTAFPPDQVTAGGTILASGLTPSRASTYRPTNPPVGQVFFDTTLNRPIWWRGADWVDSSGTVVT